jgi:DNA-binding transcriptional MerR regulator
LYQIGLFSKINHITTKTLRHYDEIGLLKPARIDYTTGYRYYTSEQLPRLHRILALRQLSLSLNEIKEILDNPGNTETLLKLKERELSGHIQEEKQKLSQIKTWLEILKGGNPMNYTPIIKKLPAAIVASMRTMAPSYESYFEIIPPMGDEMRRQGAVCAEPEYCFTIYHDGEYKEKNIDVEVCEAVVNACEDSDMVKYKKLSSVAEAICVLHKGPYSTIRNAYSFAFQWIKENKREVSGPPRESYIDGIWNRENEQEWLTELQIPIKVE